MSTLATPTAPNSPSKRKYTLEVEIPIRRTAIIRPAKPTPSSKDNIDDDDYEPVIRPAKRLRPPPSTLTRSSLSLLDRLSPLGHKSVSPSLKVHPSGRRLRTRRLDKGKDKGKRRASRSRSWSIPTISTIKRENSVLSDIAFARSRRTSIRSSLGPAAGPSGINGNHERPWTPVEVMQSGSGVNLQMLAVAAGFVEDAEAAVEMMSDGGFRAVREASERMTGGAEVVIVKAEPEKEVLSDSDDAAPNVQRERTPDEEPCCAICMNEVSEVLSDAEKEGKGGIGGGLALWVCEQRACGSLYCISCAITWANRAVDHHQPPTCPKCTRPTDIDGLRAQAKAFDPNGPADPIHAPPALPVNMWEMMGRLLQVYRTNPQGRRAGPDDVDDWVRWVQQGFMNRGRPEAQMQPLIEAARNHWRVYWEHNRRQFQAAMAAPAAPAPPAPAARAPLPLPQRVRGEGFGGLVWRIEQGAVLDNELEHDPNLAARLERDPEVARYIVQRIRDILGGRMMRLRRGVPAVFFGGRRDVLERLITEIEALIPNNPRPLNAPAANPPAGNPGRGPVPANGRHPPFHFNQHDGPQGVAAAFRQWRQNRFGMGAGIQPQPQPDIGLLLQQMALPRARPAADPIDRPAVNPIHRAAVDPNCILNMMHREQRREALLALAGARLAAGQDQVGNNANNANDMPAPPRIPGVGAYILARGAQAQPVNDRAALGAQIEAEINGILLRMPGEAGVAGDGGRVYNLGPIAAARAPGRAGAEGRRVRIVEPRGEARVRFGEVVNIPEVRFRNLNRELNREFINVPGPRPDLFRAPGAPRLAPQVLRPRQAREADAE